MWGGVEILNSFKLLIRIKVQGLQLNFEGFFWKYVQRALSRLVPVFIYVYISLYIYFI